MPQLKNAKKALRQTQSRTVRNKQIKENIKFLTKQTKQQDKGAKAQESLQSLVKAIDKAVQKGIMKKNTAARKKSRLIKQLKQTA